ncbi:MAG: phosphoribosylaminoimidazolesuccinocarboxamide synthase [Clostridiales bacterium]|nr:phosphoribosylaminoimidazolesuccinocarboxamide synthase [Clostridiales bacterium]
MKKLEQIYEGKAKKVFKTEDPDLVIVDYKDDATAFNGEKKGTILGKGAINNRMTNHFMHLLSAASVPNHFVEELSDRETLVKRVTIVPLEVIVRNIAAGSFSKRFGVREGTVFKKPTLEFSYKNDALGDPMINVSHIYAMNLAEPAELALIREYAFKINDLLKATLLECGITLVDFKLEFGKTPDGTIILADEISPDTCRFWDAKTGEKLDKDRFRQDLGNVEGAYQEMAKRLLG